MFSWIWCKKCDGSFVCVYVKIISDGPFIDFYEDSINFFIYIIKITPVLVSIVTESVF